MKRLLLFVMLALACQAVRAQVEIPRQEIFYNVNYRWGLIDVMIARGVVTIETSGNEFIGTLDGTSIPWEGKIICVSDTLRANMEHGGNSIRENVVYQSGWYRHPKVSDFRSPRYNPDEPSIFKNIAGGGTYSASANTMEAITVTSDMIGMYYFAKAIDFETLRPGERIVVPIAGPYSNQVVITYQGKGLYQGNGSHYPTYDCTFEYAFEGALSGYEVECKIGATDRVPLYMGASLPLGRVELLFEN